MKQLIEYAKKCDIKGLFTQPTTDTFIQFFRYFFVGGLAFLADAGALWVCEKAVHYLIAAALAFLVGLAVNFILSKKLVFTENKHNSIFEFIVYGVIGVMGLALTELLMYIFTDKIGLYFMISKIIAAVIVLVWNFAARKIILYKE